MGIKGVRERGAREERERWREKGRESERQRDKLTYIDAKDANARISTHVRKQINLIRY